MTTKTFTRLAFLTMLIGGMVTMFTLLFRPQSSVDKELDPSPPAGLDW